MMRLSMSTSATLKPDESSDRLSLGDALRILGRRKWLIIGFVIVTTVSAYVFSSSRPVLYSAQTQIKYQQQIDLSNPLGQSTVYPLTMDEELRAINSELGDPAIGRRVAALVGTSATDSQLKASVTVIPNTNVGTIAVTASKPQKAAAIANAYAAVFIATQKSIAQRQLLQAESVIRGELKTYRSAVSKTSTDYVLLSQQLQNLQIAEATATGNYRIISPAVAPASPSSPKPKRDAALGFMGGLLLGIALAFLLEQLNTGLRSHREVSEILNLPVVGRVPRIEKNAMASDPLAVIHDSAGAAAEALRLLRSNLDYLNVDGKLSSVLITSCIRGEGKSVTVCNLGATLALGGKDVVVVDGDLRRPRVHTYFGLPNDAGLSTVVSRKTTLADSLQTYELPMSDWQAGGNGARPSGNGSQPAGVDRRGSLRVLTSGPLPPNPGELIASETFGNVITALVAHADIVLIDTPAFIPVSDAAAIAPRVDGVFMLVNMDGTKRPMLQEAREFLDQLPTRKLGVIVVREKRARQDYYRYHSYDADPVKA